MAELQESKRRRLYGKQAPPEGENDRYTRIQLVTYVRDRWVANRMAAESSKGYARRQELRRQFGRSDKAQILQAMLPEIPRNLLAAARFLADVWQTETPIVSEPQVAGYYRGTGTMFRFSGSFSKIDHHPSLMLLRSEEVDFDTLSKTLQSAPQVISLWDDFQQWVDALSQKYGFDRVTMALEVHTQVTLERRAHPFICI